MDWQKNLLLAAMGAVIIMLVMRWDDFQKSHTSQQTTAEQTTPTPIPSSPNTAGKSADGDIPLPNLNAKAQSTPPQTAQAQKPENTKEQIITVKTGMLKLAINLHGGDIIRAALPEHKASLDKASEPFVLIDNSHGHVYVAQSGLVGKNGTDSSQGRPTYQTGKTHYRLKKGENSLQVDLTIQQKNATVIKRFTFHRGEYRVNVDYLVDNHGDQPWQASLYGQLKRDSHNPTSSGHVGMKPFLGAALTTDDDRYKKFSFDDLKNQSFNTDIKGGWVSMVQHYFISAWIPNANTENHFYLKQQNGKDLYLMGFTSAVKTIAPHSQGKLSAQFYAGPKDTDKLKAIAPYLNLTVDYGWLWWLAIPLFSALKFFHSVIGNWALSIIALTIMIKAIFFKLSATSYRSMARMRKLAPKMKTLKERYGDDRARMSQETMKLYKEEKVNPLGGCLPMLVQMPVFLALYWMLGESVELRHTAFLWIPDLSVKDPLYILPVIMGFTMWLTMRLNPAPQDPMQAKIMQFMPIGFTFMFLWFPAGLVLYWVTNNTLSFLQQKLITHQIEKADKAKAAS